MCVGGGRGVIRRFSHCLALVNITVKISPSGCDKKLAPDEKGNMWDFVLKAQFQRLGKLESFLKSIYSNYKEKMLYRVSQESTKV